MHKSSAVRVVYVVDEDAAVREGLSRLMDAQGIKAVPCTSVSEFLQQAKGLRRACVLLDLSTTRRSDPAVRTALRAVATLLPMIGLTSDDDDATRRLAREMGARSCFRKPVDASALLDSIEWLTEDANRRPGPHTHDD